MNQMDFRPYANPTVVREYIRILGDVQNPIGYVCTKIGGDEGAAIKCVA
jgi:hypothetical protein